MSNILPIAPKRMEQLSEENRKLKHYVAGVMQRLHENELLFSSLRNIEYEMMRAHSVETLCTQLARMIRDAFQLDLVRFAISEHGCIERLWFSEYAQQQIQWLNQEQSRALQSLGVSVQLFSRDSHDTIPLLRTDDAFMGSVAILLLGTPERFIGALLLGTIDAQHFHPNQSTDFLGHLAHAISLGLETTHSREERMMTPIVHTLSMSHLQMDTSVSVWFGKQVDVGCLCIQMHGAQDSVSKSWLQHDIWMEAAQERLIKHLRIQDALLETGAWSYVLCLPATSWDDAYTIAQELLAVMQQDQPDGIAVSVGIGCSERHINMPMCELVDDTNRACYIAKALGGNCLEFAENHPEGV